MSADQQDPRIEIEPVIRYPHKAEAGKTYVMTIDLRQTTASMEWPYDKEEYVIHCMLDSAPLFSNEPVGERSVILHRFGGTYGPAMFLLTANESEMSGNMRLSLVSEWGAPIDVIEIPGIQVTKEKLESRTGYVQFTRQDSVAGYTTDDRVERVVESELEQPFARETPPGVKLSRVLREDFETAIKQIAWSPDGKTLAVLGDDIHLWEAETGQLMRALNLRPTNIREAISDVSWSPDGSRLAFGDRDIQIWDAKSWVPLRVIRFGQKEVSGIWSPTWSPDGRMLALAANNSLIRIYDAETGARLRTIHTDGSQRPSIAWSPGGRALASGGWANSVLIWDATTGKELKRLEGPSRVFDNITWLPDGRILASNAEDDTICIWSVTEGRLLNILEGHSDSITALSLSGDSRLLASKSLDGTVKLWRCDRWEVVAAIDEPATSFDASTLAFHPSKHILATLDEGRRAVLIWELDLSILLGDVQSTSAYQYSIAKVVLLGDTGVGKSGLAHALVSQRFTPTESTHGRQVWRFDSQTAELPDGSLVRRDIFLWDLAGQPGYRLLHSLQLRDVALALIVFDARSEIDPFDGVRYWNQTLRQTRDSAEEYITARKLLVSARVDRGGMSVSKERLESLSSEYGFDGYFETSAKEGWQITELAEAIRQSIDWSQMPTIISTAVFLDTQEFIMLEKEKGNLLLSVDDLFNEFLSFRKPSGEAGALQLQFETAITHLESQGLVRRLRIGNYVSMQPEIIDFYASAIIAAARSEPDGLGFISESDALNARFHIQNDCRIKDKEMERLIIFEAVEEFLRNNIAWREQGIQESLLIFPAMVLRDYPEAPDPKGKEVIFSFEGAMRDIFSTLVVRLFQSRIFVKKEMWKNAVTFAARDGRTCGIFLHETGEGRGEITLFFEERASRESKALFEEFVRAHLKQHAISGSLQRRHLFTCSNCGTPVSDKFVRLRRERGFDWIACPVCSERISLLDIASAAQTETSHAGEKPGEPPRLKVFLSSTYIDLREYRERVLKLLQTSGHQTISMEQYAAAEERPLARVRSDIANADLFISVVAWKYGFIPSDSNGKSGVELEYDMALELNKPILVFMADEQSNPREPGEESEKVKAFRFRLRNSRLVDYFTDVQDLEAKVAAAVANFTSSFEAKLSDKDEEGERARDLRPPVAATTTDDAAERSVGTATPEALTKLMSDPRIRTAVAIVADAIQSLSQRLDVLSGYMKLHDSLHTLQYGYYTNIATLIREVKRDPVAASWDEISVYGLILRDQTQDMEVFAKQGSVISEEVWVQGLIDDSQALYHFLEERDVMRAERVLQSIGRVLSRQPVLINVKINETTSRLPIDQVINALSELLVIYQVADKTSDTLGEAVNSLNALLSGLEKVIEELNAWQGLDIELRRIDTSIEQDIFDLKESWPFLKDSIEQICLDVTEEWALLLKEDVGKMQDIMAARDPNPNDVKRGFSRLRSRCNYRSSALLRMVYESLKELRGTLEPLTFLFEINS